MERLNQVDAHLVGVVMNKVPTKSKGYGYGYGYGYGPLGGKRTKGREGPAPA